MIAFFQAEAFANLAVQGERSSFRDNKRKLLAQNTG
jgi:hypothetical protein